MQNKIKESIYRKMLAITEDRRKSLRLRARFGLQLGLKFGFQFRF